MAQQSTAGTGGPSTRCAGEWVSSADEVWTEGELDAALDDRRPALLDWVETFDAQSYLIAAGVDAVTRRRLELLLVASLD